MNKICLWGFTPLLFFLQTLSSQTCETVSLSPDERWQYLEYKLFIEPKKKAKSYIERNINLFLVVQSWAFTGISYSLSHMIQPTPKTFVQYREMCTLASDLLSLLGHHWIAGSVVATLWTLIRNRYLLLRRAENEVIIEILKEWPRTQHYVPEELHPSMNQQAILYVVNPDACNQQAKALISKLKHALQQHKKKEHAAKNSIQKRHKWCSLSF